MPASARAVSGVRCRCCSQGEARQVTAKQTKQVRSQFHKFTQQRSKGREACNNQVLEGCCRYTPLLFASAFLVSSIAKFVIRTSRPVSFRGNNMYLHSVRTLSISWFGSTGSETTQTWLYPPRPLHHRCPLPSVRTAFTNLPCMNSMQSHER